TQRDDTLREAGRQHARRGGVEDPGRAVAPRHWRGRVLRALRGVDAVDGEGAARRGGGAVEGQPEAQGQVRALERRTELALVRLAQDRGRGRRSRRCQSAESDEECQSGGDASAPPHRARLSDPDGAGTGGAGTLLPWITAHWAAPG